MPTKTIVLDAYCYKDNSVGCLLLSYTDTLQRDNEKLRAINR